MNRCQTGFPNHVFEANQSNFDPCREAGVALAISSDGVVTVRHTGSTDTKYMGQVCPMRVPRLSDLDMVHRDAQGAEHIEWHVR